MRCAAGRREDGGSMDQLVSPLHGGVHNVSGILAPPRSLTWRW